MLEIKLTGKEISMVELVKKIGLIPEFWNFVNHAKDNCLSQNEDNDGV